MSRTAPESHPNRHPEERSKERSKERPGERSKETSNEVRKDRRGNIPPDSLPAAADALGDDLRRRDLRRTPPESLPASRDEELPVAGHRSSEDGNNPQHPTHDDRPSDDFTPADYERAIDRAERARRAR